ncbi:hypothetical protein OX283_000585 [Flavobacterium sp. SUN052]|uniref:hypothetical protein n=1 Tax=Flavobacterium sp. SUN052 TaxID=3002441 RepID=UPI00237DD0C2|nr:hypothetical protein [Flavobacterium sp. SUN052]MEC4003138.1 hypothetical protein [Flavobacterium sp. SUN052]
MKIPNKRTLIDSKKVFTISLIIVSITILSVWFYGIGKHKTVIENSLVSTSILSIIFFLFLTISLYNGTKLKDGLGKITDKFDSKKLNFLRELNGDGGFGNSIPDVGEGIAGIIMSIILWILATIIISYLFFALGTIIWFSILVFLGMLYWIFFRALRLIFKKSSECSRNVERSIYYGIVYTILYSSWIYGIILLTKYY